VLAFGSLTTGLKKLDLDPVRVAEDLDRAWEVLAEAVQTVMRAHGIPDAYDQLKTYTRGRPMDEKSIRAFVQNLPLPEDDKERLLQLTPASYLGLAPVLARRNPT
jgi:adenylosuccinate lyase